MKSIWNLVKSNQIPGIYSNLMKSHGPEHLIPGLARPGLAMSKLGPGTTLQAPLCLISEIPAGGHPPQPESQK